MAEQTQSAVILTDEQFAFMQAHHEEIERAMMAAKLGDSAPVDALINLDDYQRLFGAMLWDDVYDRYQDTPGYDDTLTKSLHDQLREDIEAGKVTLPRTQNTRKPGLDDKTLAKMGKTIVVHAILMRDDNTYKVVEQLYEASQSQD